MVGTATSGLWLFLQQGEWVWLKKFDVGTGSELRPSCLGLLRKVGCRGLGGKMGCSQKSLLPYLGPY